jgi:hypothetical protein
MVKYTFKDVKTLTLEVAHYFNDKDIETWLEIVKKIKEEFSDIKEIILEFLGPSVFSFTREYSKKIGLTDLIFETPVKMMPAYIESENAWEVVVARWRLSIQK